MKWNPDYDRVAHELVMGSPRCYNIFKTHFPARTARSFQVQRAKAGHFTVGITSETVQRIEKYLSDYAYDDVLILGCDETKVNLSWRTDWSDEKQSWILLGGVGDPIPFRTPEELRETITKNAPEQASKVRVWNVQIPLPGIPPRPVCVVPVGSSTNGEMLLEMHHNVYAATRTAGARVLTYSCDGTAVELTTQELWANSASSTKTYTFRHPVHGQPDIVISIPVHDGFPVLNMQDNKHFWKDCRMAVHSGARFLVLGAYTITYSQLRILADAENSPLQIRDVERTDKMDDYAAARMFSAATLEFVVVHFPRWRGLIVYLFVVGDLVDAYQCRGMNNSDRLVIAFRSMFFFQFWRGFIDKAGYSSSYCLAPETMKIGLVVCNSLAGLILGHRDSRRNPSLPLAPWLHSTEGNEHTYGVSREENPNFTLWDFLMLMSKMPLLLEGEFSRQQRALPRAKTTGSGYNHTYFDSRDLDLHVAADCPTDDKIPSLITRGYDQAVSLLAAVGLVAADLTDGRSGGLPSISSMLDYDWNEAFKTGFRAPSTEQPVTPDGDAATLLHTVFSHREEDSLMRNETDQRLDALYYANIAQKLQDMEEM
ncbi:hypothetical protein EXIGLDRAFT_620792 [Exidia glandulosa HHB12029]|uniref:Uncharacterized protein n=1 Tax=Exidia glandulosa HHB12029 TaxID=1314781 RepID=A0A166A036_EXIGL|nr:hypothetical protein EXIGLDRAFT_620792 [Exidia glandulosa HHB12029]